MAVEIISRNALAVNETEKRVGTALRRSQMGDYWREDRTISEVLPHFPALDGKTLLEHLYRIRNKLDKLDPNTPLRVLDIGCGSNAELLRGLGKAYPDLNLEMVGITLPDSRSASSRSVEDNIAIERCEILEYLQRGNQDRFHAIISVATFEHLADPWYSLERVTNQLLSDDGVLFVTGVSIAIRPLIEESFGKPQYVSRGHIEDMFRERGYAIAVKLTDEEREGQQRGSILRRFFSSPAISRAITIAIKKPIGAGCMSLPIQLVRGVDTSSLDPQPLILDGISYVLTPPQETVGRLRSFTRGYG